MTGSIRNTISLHYDKYGRGRRKTLGSTTLSRDEVRLLCWDQMCVFISETSRFKERASKVI